MGEEQAHDQRQRLVPDRPEKSRAEGLKKDAEAAEATEREKLPKQQELLGKRSKIVKPGIQVDEKAGAPQIEFQAELQAGASETPWHDTEIKNIPIGLSEKTFETNQALSDSAPASTLITAEASEEASSGSEEGSG